MDDLGFQWESEQQCLTNLQKGSRTVKKLLSALVVAGFLAGLGCGDASGTKDKEKDKKTGTGTGGAMDKKGGTPDKKKDAN